MSKRLHANDDLAPGQLCIVTHLVLTGCIVREGGRRATFLGRDSGGHAMVEYDDGTREVLESDKRLRG